MPTHLLGELDSSREAVVDAHEGYRPRSLGSGSLVLRALDPWTRAMPRSARRFPVAAEFGARVRKRREAKGWSQMGLAERAGMHFTMISRLERGERNVSLQTIVRIAEALDVDPSLLMKGLKTS